MKKTILITVVCILLCIRSIQSQCPAQLDLKDVQVGLFSLTDLNNNNGNASTQIISFKQYTLSLKNTLNDAKIIVALSETSALSTGIDLFDINIISKTDTQFTLGFIYEPLKWNKVSYRYFVSNRTDLYFQMITLNQGSFKTSDNKNMIAEAQLDKPLQNFEKYEVLSFIRGLKYKNNDLIDHSFSIAIIDQKLSSNKVLFTISSVTNSSKIQLQLLSLSYLYFQPNQAEFASFGGLISKNDYVGKDRIDILHADLPSNLYLLYGITNIDITAKNFIISSSVTQDAFFSLSSSILTKRIDFTYFSIGVKAADACSNCDLKIISGKICVKECNSNEIFYQFKDGSKACQKCPDNQLSDSDHKLCVKVQKQVSPLSVNQSSGNQSQNTNVQVNQTQDLTKNNTVAAQYQQSQIYTPINPNTKIQTQQIPLVNNQTVIQSINSVQSFSSINDQNQYQGLISSTVYQPPIASTQQTNDGNAQYNFMTSQNISIIPNQQQYDQFNYCTTLTNSYWTGQSCQCKVGYKLYLASCVTIDEIQQSIEDDSSENINLNISVNNNPFIHTRHHISDLNPHFTAPNQQINATYEQSACVSTLQVYNLTTQQCQCIEGLGYKADPASNEYVCVTCQDAQGFYLQNGRCQQCSTHQIYDKINKTCVCKQGFTLDSNNNCIQPILPQPPVIPTSQLTDISTPAKNNNNTTSNQTANQNDTLKNTTSRTRDGQNRTSNNSTNTDNINTQQKNLINSTNHTSNQSEVATPTDIPIKNDSDTLKSVPQQKTVNTAIKNTTQNSTFSANTTSTTTIVNTTSGTTVQPAIPSAQTIIPCMKLTKSPQINSANIYISLSLGVEQNFRSEDEMQSFIKQDFDKDALKPSSVYCIQSETQLKDFDCLLLYPTGVPNTNFSVNFWYDDNKTNTKCNLKVQVNPLQAATKSMRSLRRR